MRFLSVWFALLTISIGLAADPPSAAAPRRIDLNTATKESIETLPGVGPKLADEIIRGRPFRSIDELDRVKGIGVKKLAQIRPLVFITPATIGASLARPPATNPQTRINLNTATPAELDSLPGIGPKRAEAIIKARPFQRPEDLLKIPGIKRAQFDPIKDRITVR